MGRKAFLLIIIGLLSATIGTCFSYSNSYFEKVEIISKEEPTVEIISKEEPTEHVEFTAEYYENVNRSMAIVNQVMSNYRTVEKVGSYERYIYSDDYGGAFLDREGYYNIGIVGCIANRPDYGGQVRYKEFEFSYNYLLRIMDSLTAIMIQYDMFSVGVNDQENRVKIYLSDEKNIDDIVKYLRYQGLFCARAILFIADPSCRIVLR